MHLENGAILGIADKHIDKTHCPAVHYSAWIDPELSIPISAKVLHGRENSFFFNEQ